MNKTPIEMIQPFEPGQEVIRAADLNALLGFVQKLRAGIASGTPGVFFQVDSEGIRFVDIRKFAPAPRWVKIMYSEVIEGWRWHYSGIEQILDGNGSFNDAYIDAALDGSQYVIFNTCEAYNPSDGTGVQGNSVNADNVPNFFQIKPILGNPVLPMVPCKLSDGTYIYFVSYENAVDGYCE